MRARSLGQNFLFDLNLTGRIARAAGPLAGVAVVEVGPGPGGLTRALLAEGAAKVIAIERDDRALPALADIGARWPGPARGRRGGRSDGRRRKRCWPRPKARRSASAPTCPTISRRRCSPAGWKRAVAAVLRSADADVSARGRAAHRRDAGRARRLRPPRRAGGLADAGADSLRRAARRLHAAAEGDVERRRTDPARRAGPCDPRLLSASTQAAFGQRRKMLRQSLKAFAATLGVDLDLASRRGRPRSDAPGGGNRRRRLRRAGARRRQIGSATLPSASTAGPARAPPAR